jgi:hypothetical protein
MFGVRILVERVEMHAFFRRFATSDEGIADGSPLRLSPEVHNLAKVVKHPGQMKPVIIWVRLA